VKYQDYYDSLGVPRDAGLDRIRKAVRKLARTQHPDMSKALDGDMYLHFDLALARISHFNPRTLTPKENLT